MEINKGETKIGLKRGKGEWVKNKNENSAGVFFCLNFIYRDTTNFANIFFVVYMKMSVFDRFIFLKTNKVELDETKKRSTFSYFIFVILISIIKFLLIFLLKFVLCFFFHFNFLFSLKNDLLFLILNITIFYV